MRWCACLCEPCYVFVVCNMRACMLFGVETTMSLILLCITEHWINCVDCLLSKNGWLCGVGETSRPHKTCQILTTGQRKAFQLTCHAEVGFALKFFKILARIWGSTGASKVGILQPASVASLTILDLAINSALFHSNSIQNGTNFTSPEQLLDCLSPQNVLL